MHLRGCNPYTKSSVSFTWDQAKSKRLSAGLRRRQMVSQCKPNDYVSIVTDSFKGMFLYARLVLDYLATNIFYSGDEIKISVNQLPEKLTDLWVSPCLLVLCTNANSPLSYRKILTQILIHLDPRSVDRIKCI